MAIAYLSKKAAQGSTSAGTTLTASFTDASSNPTTVPNGSVVFVAVISDNSVSYGGSPITSVSDQSGNTYTQLGVDEVYPGSLANDGVAGALFVAAIQGGYAIDNVTASFSQSTTARVVLAQAFSGISSSPTSVETLQRSGFGNTYDSVISSTLPIGDLYIGFAGVEYSIAPSVDTGNTGGTWVEVTAVSQGSTTSAVAGILQHKVVTVSGQSQMNGVAAGGSGCDIVNLTAQFAPGTFTFSKFTYGIRQVRQAVARASMR